MKVEGNKKTLVNILVHESNKLCADCKVSKNPRWASWNLGCFICINCSGIHRSLGVHISKVKSVDLDIWTDEQIVSMTRWNNDEFNTYWEYKLPKNFRPDARDMNEFIVCKYLKKVWVDLDSDSKKLFLAIHKNLKSRAENHDQRSCSEISQECDQKNENQECLKDIFDDVQNAHKSNGTHSDILDQKPNKTCCTYVSNDDRKRSDVKHSILSLYLTQNVDKNNNH